MTSNLLAKSALTSLIAANLSFGLAVQAESNISSEKLQNSAENSSGQGHRMIQPGQRCKPVTDTVIKRKFTRASGGHILVEGTFNQHNEITVVDTGGIGVGGVVSEAAMAKIQPSDNSNRNVDVQGANHSKPMKITSITSAGIAEAQSSQLNFVVSPGAILDGEAEALIGSEFLCSFVVEFDFKSEQLVLHPQNTSLEQLLRNPSKNREELIWGTISNQSHIAGAIIITMTMDDKPVKAVLDTGARHSIMNWKAAKLLGLEKGAPQIIVEKNKAKGIHGNAAKDSFRTKVSNLALPNGKIKSEDVDMRISDMGSFGPLVGDTAAVNLGVDFFEGRRLIIDYTNRKIAVSN